MSEQRPSQPCPVCETPDGDHLDWCTPQARGEKTEQRPSKDQLSVRLRNLFEDVRCDPLDYGELVAEVERLEITAAVDERLDRVERELAPVHGGRIMTLAECVEAEGGIPFVGMEASTEPLTHQEIFSAVHHHASEIVRLTAAVPAQCSSQPLGDRQ